MQDQQTDQSDLSKPWTIKGVQPNVRQAAINAATADGLTQGEWLNRNIPLIITQNRRENRLPVPVSPPVRPSDPEADLAAIERLVTVLKELRGVTDTPPPKRTVGLMHRLVTDRLRALRDGGSQTNGAAKSDPEGVEVLPTNREVQDVAAE